VRAVAVGLRQAEIEDLDGAVFGQEHVGRLQVAVDDAAGVRGVEGVDKRDRVFDEPVDGQRAVPEHLVQ
jgi:hypothetical protein